jgi:predicted acetylornithine/succinylornithine family transaminase
VSAETSTTSAGPSLQELQELERTYAIPTYARNPVQFVRGEGVRLWDEDGNEYLDFLAGISVLNVGHCHPKVVEAVGEQLKRLTHVTNLYYTAPAMQLSAKLAQSSLGGKVFLCNSGAEANEAAIKLARRVRPGGDIVVLRDGFHGRTYGALSATPQEAKQAPFAPLVPGFTVVPKDPEAVRSAVGEHTAAVLLEPIQGESGVLEVPLGVLRAAREACDATGAALIFDEVQTGMGRTGTLWAYQGLDGIVPDALTTAKGLGGGLPIGALVTGPRLADGLQPGDHGSTFAGGPVACAAALVALEICSDPELLRAVVEHGERLASAVADLPGVTAVRGRGLIRAFDVAVGVPAPELARRALLEERLVVNATGPATIRLEPPLIVGRAEIDEAVERLGRLLSVIGAEA